MDHNISLITTIAAGFGVALIFGFIAERIKLPALVGYLVAGILIGPATPGFVADSHLAGQLSEIGIMLLMFGVGLHFFAERFTRGKTYRRAGGGGADGARHRAWHVCRMVLGVEFRRRAYFRPFAFLCQYRGAAQGAGSAQGA